MTRAPLQLTLLVCILTGLVGEASPPQAVAAALRDLQTVPTGVRESVRWLYFADHLTAEKRRQLWETCSSNCNRQSREVNVVPPLLVLSNGEVKTWTAMAAADWGNVVLARVSLLDYRWNPRTWDKFGFRNILFNTVLDEVTEVASESTVYEGNKFYRELPNGAWVAEAKWKPTRTKRRFVALAPSLAETDEGRKTLVALLLALTDSKGRVPTTPIVDAEYFVWEISIQVNRNVGYYGLIDIKNQRDFERLGGFDPKADVDPAWFSEVIDAVSGKKSGVSIHNRLVRRRQGFGPYYLTGDVQQAINEFNPLRFVSVQAGFKDNAREGFIRTPNGFWAVGLFVGSAPLVAGTKDGDRQDSAPDFVGFFHQSRDNDGRIHVGFTCQVCHANGGLQDSNGWFRPMLRDNKFLQTVDPKLLGTLQAHAGPLNDLIARDRLAYESAVKSANGLDSKTDSNQWADWYYSYDAGVTLERAARDAGLAPKDFAERFYKHFTATRFADTVLGTWVASPENQQPLHIDDYVESYNLIQLTIRGLSQWPIEVKNAIKVVKP